MDPQFAILFVRGFHDGQVARDDTRTVPAQRES